MISVQELAPPFDDMLDTIPRTVAASAAVPVVTKDERFTMILTAHERFMLERLAIHHGISAASWVRMRVREEFRGLEEYKSELMADLEARLRAKAKRAATLKAAKAAKTTKTRATAPTAKTKSKR